MPDPGARLLQWWTRLSPWPGGPWLFSRLLGRVAPYSASIHPHVTHLAPGHAVVAMQDRRAVRNPFASIHAAALTNLGELASGLAVWTVMPHTLRAIITGLDIQFVKKARGRLVAEARVALPHVTGPVDVPAVALLRDAGGDVVAQVTATWRLDRRP